MADKPLKTKNARSSRAKYACKPEIQKMIDWINLVPPDKEMKTTPELTGEDGKRFLTGTYEYKRYELRRAKAFITYLETFPQKVKEGIFTLEKLQTMYNAFEEAEELFKETPHPKIGALRDELESRLSELFFTQERLYYSLRNARNTFYRLAEIGENIEPYLGQKLDGVVLGMTLFLEYGHLDKDGRLRRSPNPFAEALEGIEVSRIRVCLICRKLFWASRNDKRCCSEEHSRIIRQRQVRENQRINKGIYGRAAKKRKVSEGEKREDLHKDIARDNTKL